MEKDLEIFELEAKACLLVREKMLTFIKDPNTSQNIKDFYVLLQKSLLDALDAAYLAYKDRFKQYFSSSASVASDAVKFVALFLPSQYQFAMQIVQAALMILKDAHILGDTIKNSLTYEQAIQNKATRLIISEDLAQKITYEYSEILQNVSPASYRDLINSIIKRLDIGLLLSDQKLNAPLVDRELNDDVTIMMRSDNVIPEKDIVKVTADDILARPLIVCDNQGEKTYYKTLGHKNTKRVSGLGVRRVANVELQDQKYKKLLPMQEYVKQESVDKLDFVSCLYIDINECRSLDQLNELKELVSEENEIRYRSLLQQYLFTYHGLATKKDLRNFVPLARHRDTTSEISSTFICYLGYEKLPTDSTRYLLEAIKQRMLVIKPIKAARATEQSTESKPIATAKESASAIAQTRRVRINFNVLPSSTEDTGGKSLLKSGPN